MTGVIGGLTRESASPWDRERLPGVQIILISPCPGYDCLANTTAPVSSKFNNDSGSITFQPMAINWS